jgi:hypothetical protein
LVIENDFRDYGGVPPLLSYSTSVKDRRFIVQRVLPPEPGQPSNPGRSGLIDVSWECDRYEVHERGMKEETSFDSLRDLYPPPTLWELGGIPGSIVKFTIDPRTGKAAGIQARLASIAGGGTPGKLSHIAERCTLNIENLQRLLQDLGPLYLPDSSKRVGESWTKTFRENHKSLGVVVTELTCTLRSVGDQDHGGAAEIDLNGRLSLENGAKNSREGTGTTSAASQKSPSNNRQYRLDKAECNGSVQFDLVRGMLLQLTLHREVEFVADLEATQPNPIATQIRSGAAQDLRVRVSDAPAPKPVIVGGPRPPVVPADDRPKTHSPSPTSRPTTRQAGPSPENLGPAARPPVPTQPTRQPATTRRTDGPDADVRDLPRGSIGRTNPLRPAATTQPGGTRVAPRPPKGSAVPGSPPSAAPGSDRLPPGRRP